MTNTPDDIDDDDLSPDDEAGDSQILTADVEAGESGERLDRVLAGHFTDLSRARLQALIAEGRLSIDGKVIADGKHKARAGTYVLSIPAPVAAKPEPQNIPLDILFEDEHLIVVNKPVGMAAHPAPGTRDGTEASTRDRGCSSEIFLKSSGRFSVANVQGPVNPGDVNQRPVTRKYTGPFAPSRNRSDSLLLTHINFVPVTG